MDALTRREFLEWAMAESVPVRCPACRREHLYAAPSYPCVCGSPVTAPLDPLAEPTPVTRRAWDDEWTAVRCGACGRATQWPHPELGCPCGAMLRIPLRTTPEDRTPAPRTDATAPGPGAIPQGGHPASAPDTRDDGDRTGALDREDDTRRDDTIGADPMAEHRCPQADLDSTATAPGARAAEPDPAGDGGRRGAREAEEGAARDGHAAADPDGEDRAPDDRATAADAPRDGQGNAGAGHPDPEVVDGPGAGSGQGEGSGPGEGKGRRSVFRPVAIRTARDAVTAAALYLGWLGYRDIRRADQRPTTGIGLAARGILAQVDPTVRPASLRDVECLWLTAMTESSDCVFFSLAGYAEDARARADSLGVPLFVLDLTGTPQPVNSPADELIAVTD